MIITTITPHVIEGTSTGKAWTLEIIDKQNLITESIKEKLKNFSEQIFWNDNNELKHNIFCKFDFIIDNVWFESMEVDCNNMKVVLNAFK